MDNNSNSNVSGIPSVNDIKFDDTPAESFENLYGGSNQGINNGVGTVPNMVTNNIGVQTQPGVQNAQMVQNPGVVNSTTVQPVSNVGVQPSVGTSVNPVNVDSTVIPNNVQTNAVTMNNNVGMVQNSQMVQNPSVNQVPVQPNNVGVQPSVSSQVVQNPINVGQMNGVGVQSNPSIAPSINQGAMMTPNPINVSSNGIDISSVNIDAEKMQSIEEQLSKTSQYNPADFQQEQISIPTDNQSEKNKSGLAFVIVLFILLGVAIALMPQITKLIK